MVKVSDLDITIEGANRSILVRGTTYNLVTDLNELILKEECLTCSKDRHSMCLLTPSKVERGSYCELNWDSDRQAKYAEAPSPASPDALFQAHLMKHNLILVDGQMVKKPPEVAPEPVVEPVKKPTLTEKVRGLLNF
jgi:hypothetical protein